MLDQIQDLFMRHWHDLIERPSGPMSFRFLLQPAMALIAAFKDGIKDGKTGRSPYFWTIVSNPVERKQRLREGLAATGRIIVLGLIMDTIYQIIIFKAFRPVEAIIVALTLAFLPYLLLRGPVARVYRWWRANHPPHTPSPEA
jgi:hypothetical protein